MKNAIPGTIPTEEESDKLEETACIEIIKALLAKEYAKPDRERDEALIEEAWATFEEITGVKTTFSPEEIDALVKEIIEKNTSIIPEIPAEET